VSFRLESPRTCLECGFLIGEGGYADRVLVPLRNGRRQERFLHGGPCSMRYSRRSDALTVLPNRTGS
jgi:hypothetical protein